MPVGRPVVGGEAHTDQRPRRDLRRVNEERSFEDGEHKIRPLVDVNRRDVFVIHSLYGSADASPNDKLCRFMFLIGALKDAGAARVTAIVPYLCYARKDQRSQLRDPITTKYVARMFQARGVEAVMTYDVHNRAAFENAFRIPAANIEAMPLFVEHFARLLRHDKIAVVSPDIGGAKRAERFRRVLGGTEFDGIVVCDTVRSAAEAAGSLPATVTIVDTLPLVCEGSALTHSGLQELAMKRIRRDVDWFRPRVVHASGMLAAILPLLSPVGAVAAPKRLDCKLTSLETRTVQTTDVVAENRSIAVVFDQEAKALTVYPDGSARRR